MNHESLTQPTLEAPSFVHRVAGTVKAIGNKAIQAFDDFCYLDDELTQNADGTRSSLTDRESSNDVTSHETIAPNAGRLVVKSSEISINRLSTGGRTQHSDAGVENTYLSEIRGRKLSDEELLSV